MEFFKIGDLPFRLIDAVDILVVAVLIYQLFRFVKGTIAVPILIVVITIFLIWQMANLLNMAVLGTLLGEFVGVGVIAIIVIFQTEIRRFMIRTGKNTFVYKLVNKEIRRHPQVNFELIADTIKELALKRMGAILVFTRSNKLDHVMETGERIDSNLTQGLLISIFHLRSPLHDGAVIVNDNHILAARCILPISDNPGLPAAMGLRHRAAIGISEVSDAAAVVVSEETGNLSLAYNREIFSNLKAEELIERLKAYLSEEER